MKKTLAIALTAFLALPFIGVQAADAQTSQPCKAQQQQDQDTQNQWFKSFSEKYHIDFNNLFQSYSGNTNVQDESKATNNQKVQVKEPTKTQPKAEPKKDSTKADKTQKQEQAKPAAQNQSTATKEPQADKSQQSSSQLNAFEQKVVELTNQERAKQGLKALKVDNGLAKMARDKSQDMADKGYFDHQSPTYGSPFDMMGSYGITYTSAGENIAAGQPTPQAVVDAWMKSPGHRANILNTSYSYIGVGYVKGGSYGHYWTQEFINK